MRDWLARLFGQKRKAPTVAPPVPHPRVLQLFRMAAPPGVPAEAVRCSGCRAPAVMCWSQPYTNPGGRLCIVMRVQMARVLRMDQSEFARAQRRLLVKHIEESFAAILKGAHG